MATLVLGGVESLRAGGVLWAGLTLVVYGIDDIVTDMIFNTVGALLVAVWGSDYFDDFVPFVRGWLRAADEK